MTLAEGTAVSLANAKLMRGRNADPARLKQMLSISDEGKPAPKALPADPALAFAERAAAALGPSLLHC